MIRGNNDVYELALAQAMQVYQAQFGDDGATTARQFGRHVLWYVHVLERGWPVEREGPPGSSRVPVDAINKARWRIVRREGALAAVKYTRPDDEVIGHRWDGPDESARYVLWCWCDEHGDQFKGELARLSQQMQAERAHQEALL